MASALSSSQDTTDMQLRAANHLTNIYIDTVSELPPAQLQQVTSQTHLDQLIRDMTSMLSDNVPKSLIERECRAVSPLLHNAARDHILDSPTSQRTVKDRVSSMFLTPLKLIRDRPRTTGTSLTSHSSTDTIDELMQLSQCESHCDSQPT